MSEAVIYDLKVRLGDALDTIAALERDKVRLVSGLVRMYPEAPGIIAHLCDEYIDRSGRLLGDVRSAARAAKLRAAACSEVAEATQRGEGD